MTDAPERIWFMPDEGEIDPYGWAGVQSGKDKLYWETEPAHHPFDDGVEYVRADLAPQWQPIETAPRDGRKILVWCPHPWSMVDTVVWFDPWGVWLRDDILPDPEKDEMYGMGSEVPSHWMPLPSPPSDQ